MPQPDLYTRSVFINCPFSPDYQPIFRAILFAVFACSFRPRCAREISDSSQNRLAKIEGIIRQSQFGIHDISFMSIDPTTKLPRLNMSFELGLFLAAKSFGRIGRSGRLRLFSTNPDIGTATHCRIFRVKILHSTTAIQKKRSAKFETGWTPVRAGLTRYRAVSTSVINTRNFAINCQRRWKRYL